mgnify:FL=1
MTADSFDNFDYEKASEHTSESSRRHYWAVAIGLQDVDGLNVSSYLRETAASYIKGEKTIAETGGLVCAYHAGNADEACAEADLVSQRIVELLERGVFYLAPEMLSEIHRYLFQDLDRDMYRRGQFKTERMVKQEGILNGESVLYADPMAYDMSLRGAFASEAAKAYTTFSADELKSFCHFTASLWRIHPFVKGNTRTVAVFSELYLNYLGFDVTNEPFGKHARFYRDALVRAMYRNAPAGVMPDDRFLIAFYENALGFAENDLSREDLICTPLFENPDLLCNVDPKEALKRDASSGFAS